MLEEIEKNIDYGDVYDKKADIVNLIGIINKLINYIAVRENKDYEEVRKEFDI